MVSGVQNSLGATAYLKSSQLGSGSGTPAFKKQVTEQNTQDPTKAQESRSAESAQTQRSTDSKDSQRAPDTTQLQARNEDQTLQTEQARGSLLDLAV